MPAADNYYMFPRARVFAAAKDPVTGLPGAFTWLGNFTDAMVKFQEQILKHFESYSGDDFQDEVVGYRREGTFEATAENFNLDMLALALYGSKAAVAGGTVTNEVLPTGFSVGDYLFTKNPDIGTVVITDSTGGTTYVAGTDYRVDDAKTGRIKVLSAAFATASATLAPLIDYIYDVRTDFAMFSQPAPERWIRLEVINKLDSKKRIIELYRVRINLADQLPTITSDKFADFKLTGEVLADTLQPLGSSLGSFGDIKVLV
jgi:hypothetical protein